MHCSSSLELIRSICTQNGIILTVCRLIPHSTTVIVDRNIHGFLLLGFFCGDGSGHSGSLAGPLPGLRTMAAPGIRSPARAATSSRTPWPIILAGGSVGQSTTHDSAKKEVGRRARATTLTKGADRPPPYECCWYFLTLT